MLEVNRTLRLPDNECFAEPQQKTGIAQVRRRTKKAANPPGLTAAPDRSSRCGMDHREGHPMMGSATSSRTLTLGIGTSCPAGAGHLQTASASLQIWYASL